MPAFLLLAGFAAVATWLTIDFGGLKVRASECALVIEPSPAERPIHLAVTLPQRLPKIGIESPDCLNSKCRPIPERLSRKKVRDGEGAVASTRGAALPQRDALAARPCSKFTIALRRLHLDYCAERLIHLGRLGLKGFEPLTLRLSSACSNQLSCRLRDSASGAEGTEQWSELVDWSRWDRTLRGR